MMRRLQRGFTLLEAIIVIVITGAIASVVAIFIVSPIEGYLDTTARAELSDVADTALRRIARDIRLALPNSIRTSVGSDGNVYLELLLTKTGGRYLAEEDDHLTSGSGRPLRFSSSTCPGTVADCQFHILGAWPAGVQTIAVGDEIVVFNLGPGYDPVDAYNCTPGPCNRAAITAVDAANGLITLAANPFAQQVPRMRSPSNRFQVVTTPVTYVCANGQLIRYWGYAIQSAQPDDRTVAPLSSPGTKNALLATDVATCNFTSNILATRNGAMVELQMMMGSAAARSGAIRLVHQILVDNTP